MRSVLTFWQTPEDEAAFFKFLSREDVVVYPLGAVAEELGLSPISLPNYVQKHTGEGGLLSLRSLQDDVKPYKIDRDGQTVFAINPSKASVLGYAPGMLKANTLTVTNVAAFWDMLRDGAVVKKSDAFCKWGKAVFKWLRKRVREHEGAAFPMTDAAADASRKGAKLIEGSS